jgi:hypothetical protein
MHTSVSLPILVPPSFIPPKFGIGETRAFAGAIVVDHDLDFEVENGTTTHFSRS